VSRGCKKKKTTYAHTCQIAQSVTLRQSRLAEAAHSVAAAPQLWLASQMDQKTVASVGFGRGSGCCCCCRGCCCSESGAGFGGEASKQKTEEASKKRALVVSWGAPWVRHCALLATAAETRPGPKCPWCRPARRNDPLRSRCWRREDFLRTLSRRRAGMRESNIRISTSACQEQEIIQATSVTVPMLLT